MKKILNFLIIFVAIVAIGSLLDDGNEEENLQEVSNQDKNTNNGEVAKSSNSDEEKDMFIGDYSFTDKFGYKVLLKIKDDGTATVSCTDKNGQTFDYYCSWTNNYEIGLGITIHFSDSKPSLNFDGGMDNLLEPYCLIGDYIYTGYDNTKSKNPRWRLKVVKVK